MTVIPWELQTGGLEYRVPGQVDYKRPCHNKNKIKETAKVTHIFNLSTEETEADRSLEGCHSLQSYRPVRAT